MRTRTKVILIALIFALGAESVRDPHMWVTAKKEAVVAIRYVGRHLARA